MAEGSNLALLVLADDRHRTCSKPTWPASGHLLRAHGARQRLTRRAAGGAGRCHGRRLRPAPAVWRDGRGNGRPPATRTPNTERWVRAQARQVLAGRAGIVATAIRRKATYHGLDPGKRKPADAAAAYLLARKPYLDYPTALARGWPIATGVIEGACRHLVKDRMDVTGARWGLDGAEAILKLRTLISNGDFDQYWTWHLAGTWPKNNNASTTTATKATSSHSR